MVVYEEYEVDAQGLRDKLWSGGKDTLDDLTDDEIDEVLSILESAIEDPDRGMELTELNDFFWFDRDTIAEWLGYDEYDELMNR